MPKTTGSIIISGSKIRGNVTNNSTATETITPEMWGAISAFAQANACHEAGGNLRDLRGLILEGRSREAKPIWLRVKASLSSFIQQSANIAQIVKAIDSLTQ